jgi:hypothetical protein
MGLIMGTQNIMSSDYGSNISVITGRSPHTVETSFEVDEK